MRNIEKSMEEHADELYEVAHIEDIRASAYMAEVALNEIVEMPGYSHEEQMTAHNYRGETWLRHEKAKTLNYLFYKEIQEFEE